jgi:hypothetical protein
MSASTATDYLGVMPSQSKSDYAPTAGSLQEIEWDELLQKAAEAPERKQALIALLNRLHEEDPDTKIAVFAASGAAFEAARAALEGEDMDDCEDEALVPTAHAATVVGQNRTVVEFGQKDVIAADKLRPRVLLLSFDHAAGHNFQYVSRDVVLFAPLWNG